MELDSAGPGDAVSSRGRPAWGSGDLTVGDAVGNDASLFLPTGSVGLVGRELPGRGEACPSFRMAVLVDVSRLILGRIGIPSGVVLVLPSCRGMGESRRPESAEVVRSWAGRVDSEPGMGEGADDPLAAAVAFRTWARTWDACLSVRYATCCRRKSTGTSKRSALRTLVSRNDSLVCWVHGRRHRTLCSLLQCYGQKEDKKCVESKRITYNLSRSAPHRIGSSRELHPWSSPSAPRSLISQCRESAISSHILPNSREGGLQNHPAV